MRRIGVSLIFVLVLSAVAAFSAVASAETFSQPVRLSSAPGLVWDFAVNDRGQAVAVEGNAHGASVFPIGRNGHLGKPWQVKLPGGFPGSETSVTLDSRGRIAVGILYQDDTAEPNQRTPGCCLRVAVASWKLGSKPPTAQSLSPPQDAETGYPHQALLAPLLMIGPSAITALWTIGSEPEREHRSGPGEVQIEQAFGPFGSRLRSAQLFAAPKGVVAPHLSLEPNGDPVASWLDDVNKIRTVTGSHSGALRRPTRVQRAPELSQPVGFTNDDEGDTIFSYFSSSSKNTSELRYMTSQGGGPFTHPRGIGLTDSESPGATVLAGGHRTLLAFWGCSGLDIVCKEQRKIGTVSGAFSRSFTPLESPKGVIDSSGRTLIVYNTEHGLYETTAERGKPFMPPRRFAAPLPHYFQLGMDQDEESPLLTSPNGHAILCFADYANGENEQYLVRYTP
jgi:hypothetical protein